MFAERVPVITYTQYIYKSVLCQRNSDLTIQVQRFLTAFTGMLKLPTVVNAELEKNRQHFSVEFHIIYTMIANDFSTFRQFL
jgi:hypothetical protein